MIQDDSDFTPEEETFDWELEDGEDPDDKADRLYMELKDNW